MTFVMADSCRSQLERLTQILVSAFPGSTIYQHTDVFRVPHDVLSHRVDAVFLEAEPEKANGLDFMNMLRRQKPDVPVFLIARAPGFREEAEAAGADGCFVLPEDEQQFLEAVRSVKNKEKIL